MGAFHLTMKVQFVEGNLKLGLRPSDTALTPRCINFENCSYFDQFINMKFNRMIMVLKVVKH